MIVDVIPFLNELDLLELRLNHLKPLVDLTILAEAPLTFSGLPKPLYFNDNKSRFSAFNIHHVVVNSIPGENHGAWERDLYQKQKAFEQIARFDPEIALLCDLDEVPSLDAIERFRQSDIPTAALNQDMLLFYFNRHDPTTPWNYARITRDFKNNANRYVNAYPELAHAGWHFEYFGSRHTLLEKISATAHAQEPGGLDFYAKVEAGNLDGLSRTVHYPVDKLPEYVRNNMQKYLDLGFFSMVLDHLLEATAS